MSEKSQYIKIEIDNNTFVLQFIEEIQGTIISYHIEIYSFINEEKYYESKLDDNISLSISGTYFEYQDGSKNDIKNNYEINYIDSEISAKLVHGNETVTYKTTNNAEYLFNSLNDSEEIVEFFEKHKKYLPSILLKNITKISILNLLIKKNIKLELKFSVENYKISRIDQIPLLNYLNIFCKDHEELICPELFISKEFA